MKTRILTAIVMIAVFGTIVVFGEGDLSFLFSGGILLLTVAGSYEFMIRAHRAQKVIYWYHYLPIGLSTLFVLVNILFFNESQYYQVLALMMLTIVMIYLILYLFDQRMHRGELGVSLVGVFYLGIGFSGLAFIRQLGLTNFIYLILITVSTDTFAYFIGIRFGKHKLMPKVSPKKSIEGAIGGLVMAGIIGSLFALSYDLFDHHIIVVVLVTLGLSMVSQAGDLVASKFKREVKIKDYSHLFPGHGGVLDRFDSLLFAGAFFMIITMVIS